MLTKIRKYLTKHPDVSFIKENNSGSLYFKVNDLEIRVSNHVATFQSRPECLQVIISADNKGAIILLNNKPIIFKDYRNLRDYLRFYIKSSFALTLIPRFKEVVKEVIVEKEVILKDYEQQVLDLLNKCAPRYIPVVINDLKEKSNSKASKEWNSDNLSRIFIWKHLTYNVHDLIPSQLKDLYSYNFKNAREIEKLLNKFRHDNNH